IVNDYLMEHFKDIMDFKFTAKVADEFDDVAEGKLPWSKMIDNFYVEFHNKVNKAEGEESSSSGASNELGVHPESGKRRFAKIGKFGPYLQIGEATDEEKPEFISLKKGTLIASLSFEEAMEVIKGPKLPLELGMFEDQAVVVNEGRYGPYVLHNSKFYNLDK